MTRAVPASCRSIARLISTSRQYREARKSALTSSRMTPASSRFWLMAPSHSVPAAMRRSCQPLMTPWLLQEAQVGLELLPQGLVLVRVRVEQAYRGRGAFRGGHGTGALRVRKDAGGRGGDVRAPTAVMGPILRAARAGLSGKWESRRGRRGSSKPSGNRWGHKARSGLGGVPEDEGGYHARLQRADRGGIRGSAAFEPRCFALAFKTPLCTPVLHRSPPSDPSTIRNCTEDSTNSMKQSTIGADKKGSPHKTQSVHMSLGIQVP